MGQLYDDLEEFVHGTDTARVNALGDSLQLGPLDHVSSELVYLAVCFVYVSEISLPRLRIALSRTLDRYPHLTGRFHIDGSGNRSIDCFGAGALLQSAASRMRLSDARDEAGRIDMMKLPGAGSILVPSYVPSREHGDPVLSIKMTVFEGGSGTVLGIRAPHSVCDAAGFFTLVNHLTQAYGASGLSHRNQASVDALPYAPSTDIPTSTTNAYPLHDEQAPLIHSEGSNAPIEGRFLHFDSAHLQKLKKEAVPAQDTTSKYRALTAHLWQTSQRAALIHRQRHSSIDGLNIDGPGSRNGARLPDVSGLTIAVNLRNRLPSIPSDMVFNAVLPCSTTMPSELLDKGDLRDVARAINTMLRRDLFVQHAVMESAIDWIHRQHDKTRIGFGWAGHFVSTQWPSDMYQTSAMDGLRPDLICLPFLPGVVDGLLIVLPGPVQRTRQGDIEVVTQNEDLMAALCLEKYTWDIIDELGMLSEDRTGRIDRAQG